MIESAVVAHCPECGHAMQFTPLKIPVKNFATSLIDGFKVYASGCLCGQFQVEELDEKQKKILNRGTKVWVK